MSATLTFLGAAGTVTGAKFLLETAGARVLLDCGLFQGPRELRARNWESAVPGSTGLDAVLLSHAHVDHSGWLPRLAREGFRGPVYCTPGTADLLAIMLPDAARLEEEEAEFRNRAGATRYRPALPLFTEDDARQALALVRRVPFGERRDPARGVSARFLPGGHILGASIVDVGVGDRRLVYSGDLGRYDVPLLRDPARVEVADTLLVESTYGDRRHPADDGSPALVTAVQRAVERGGILLVPAFAVGRTQEILYLLRMLEDAGRIPRVPVYLDSPMATAATVVYALHTEEHDADLAQRASAGERPFAPARFHLSATPADSRRLNALDGPAIIVAGSGMATGGRVLHHLRQRLGDPRTTVLFVGFQAPGTRGRALADGADRVRIFGEDVAVRATVSTTDALSAHADRDGILRWLGGFARPPAATWIVHGEPGAAEALRAAIVKDLGWPGVGVAAAGARVAV